MGDGEPHSEWDSFFTDLEAFNQVRHLQKQSGLNDFNVLGMVLSVNDEIRLHTRFLYGLLNPSSKHYQGARFLDLFLEHLGRPEWLNTSCAVVKKEFCPRDESSQIDLYITDGSRQIVIENKLNAHDQERQVARYLEAVNASAENADDTLFIYLTKGRSRPSIYGLGNLKIIDSGGELVLTDADNQAVAKYQNLHYRHSVSDLSIHHWLNACEQVTTSQSGLPYAIKEYRGVIERATGEYSSNVKTLQEHLEEGIKEGKPYHQQAMELARELPSIHEAWLHEAMTTQVDDVFHSALQDGTVVRLGKEDAEMLDRFVASGKKGFESNLIYTKNANFFAEKSKSARTNRGAFFLVRSEPYSENVILMLYYGSSRLHVGYLLTDDCANAPTSTPFSMKMEHPPKLREHVFPQAVTFSEDLTTKGVIHMADFANSPQKEILEKLIAYFLSGKANT